MRQFFLFIFLFLLLGGCGRHKFMLAYETSGDEVSPSDLNLESRAAVTKEKVIITPAVIGPTTAATPYPVLPPSEVK